MSGVFRSIERHVIRPVAHGVRNVARVVAPAVAPVLAIATGNPLLAAAGGAGARAIAGGNSRDILSAAAGGALGTMAGATMVGGAVGRSLARGAATVAMSNTRVGKQLAPVIMAASTGNPLLAAAGGAHAAVARGANLRETAMTAAAAGIGAAIGAGSPGQFSAVNLGAAKGALAGKLAADTVGEFLSSGRAMRRLGEDISRSQAPRPEEEKIIKSSHSFSDLRENVVKETEKVFEENQLIVASHAARPTTLVTIYNRRFFEPLKDLMRRRRGRAVR